MAHCRALVQPFSDPFWDFMVVHFQEAQFLATRSFELPSELEIVLKFRWAVTDSPGQGYESIHYTEGVPGQPARSSKRKWLSSRSWPAPSR